MNKFVERLSNLITIKSLVTLTFTGLITHLAVAGHIPQEILSIYMMIIGFYFGTQSEKNK